jgi:hypothetical protein
MMVINDQQIRKGQTLIGKRHKKAEKKIRRERPQGK